MPLAQILPILPTKTEVEADECDEKPFQVLPVAIPITSTSAVEVHAAESSVPIHGLIPHGDSNLKRLSKKEKGSQKSRSKDQEVVIIETTRKRLKVWETMCDWCGRRY